MRDYHNIDKSPFRGRQYTGYGSGAVWHITGQHGAWRATVDPAQQGVALVNRTVRAPTLAAISTAITCAV